MAITHYELLGVAPDASRSEITAAFRAQMRALHGDAGGNDELAKQVSSAFNVLSNAERRAKYDRTLFYERSSSASAPTPPPSSEPTRGRRKVFRPDRDVPDVSMMTADPTAWGSWYTAPDDQAPARSRLRRSPHIVRRVLLALGFLAWVLAGAAAARTIGLPLARVGILDVVPALAVGAGIHLVWSALVFFRALHSRWGVISTLVLAGAAAAVIYRDAGTPLPMLGSPLCLVASALTTRLSFVIALSRSGRTDGDKIMRSSFITQAGATSLGERPADIDRLLGALVGAFGQREGVRVILLPDRVTPHRDASPVRSQVAVVIGRTLHLVAIPSIGADGMEIAGSDLIADGSVYRNVVRDEMRALESRFGRTGKVRGYVIPTRMVSSQPRAATVDGVTFGSLTQVIDEMGSVAGAHLDKPNTLFRSQALQAMAILL
ncbi:MULTISPECIES: J domain-containing protein [Brachybacterium]|uniref:J domain-containing protein n=1 Tax=Brachybacterium kimchii TaxID=2942909 RepID=A0ABY4N934_9MICO|nr:MULTISPECIES: J domain-containing protein [Brachybacterium]MCG7308014.1 J domain-containing protein [Brachybacterium sp. ACRRE]UQN30616.1 J domain-containing protein [Brachybacterium kimchii]